MSRCTGHCCEKFSLPLSPMELQHAAKKQAKGWPARFSNPDMGKVAEMVIPLGTHYRGTPHANVRGRKREKNAPWDTRAKQAREWWYTCKYYDPETRNCTNYENRPSICREFPGSGTCKYRGCTYKEQCQSAEARTAKPEPEMLKELKE